MMFVLIGIDGNSINKQTPIIYDVCSMFCRIYTVGKHTPSKLSFVYTSYIRFGVQAAPKFGKHTSLFSYHKDKNYL